MSTIISQTKSSIVTRRKFLKLSGTSVAIGTLSSLAAACAAAPPVAPSATTATNTSAASTVAPVTALNTSMPALDLLYYIVGNIQKETDLVAQELGKKAKERINANVTIKTYEWAEYPQKMQLINAAGEKYDLSYVASWLNPSYYVNATNGALLALDDLLPEHAPKLWASLKPQIWNAARINGKIYAAINEQIFVFPFGAVMRKDLVDKYKIDVDKIKSWADLEPFAAEIKKNEPGITPFYSEQGLYPGGTVQSDFNDYEAPGGVYVKWDDKDLKGQSADFIPPGAKEAVQLATQWRDAKYWTTDDLPLAEARAGFKSGKYGMLINDVTKPSNATEKKAMLGYELVQKTIQPSLMTTGGVTATMTGISKTTADAKRSMMLIELLCTDIEIYNLISKGIEGKHWEWKDKAQKIIGFPAGVDAKTSGYNPQTDWMFGNQFLAYYTDPAQVGDWDRTRELNNSSRISEMLGFVFIPDAVKSEVAAVGAAGAEIVGRINKGESSDLEGDYAKVAQAKLDAGYEKVRTELQKQLDAFKASKK